MRFCNYLFISSISAILLCFAPSSAFAQNQETNSPRISPPSDPVIIFPEKAIWEIVIQPLERLEFTQSSQISNQQVAKKIVLTKLKNVICKISHHADQTTSIKWQIGEVFYLKPKGQSFWSAYTMDWQSDNLPSNPELMPIPRFAFEGLEWVGQSNFAGQIELEGRLKWVFIPSKKPAAKIFQLKDLENIPQFVLVDAETRLPAYYKSATQIQVYDFTRPFPSDFAPPADLIQEIREGEERRAKIFKVPKG